MPNPINNHNLQITTSLFYFIHKEKEKKWESYTYITFLGFNSNPTIDIVTNSLN